MDRPGSRALCLPQVFSGRFPRTGAYALFFRDPFPVILLNKEDIVVMSEQQKTNSGLFREKTVAAMDSPESLNDYLRVTSPKVWIVLAAVVMLLVGGILWGIFGRIHTTAQVAVWVGEDKRVCFVPYEQAEAVMNRGVVSVDGREFPLQTGSGISMDQMYKLPDDTPYDILVHGNLQVGDWVFEVPVTINLSLGCYTGEVVTEDLRPLSLLLQ